MPPFSQASSCNKTISRATPALGTSWNYNNMYLKLKPVSKKKTLQSNPLQLVL